jgi:hypothetical protein
MTSRSIKKHRERSIVFNNNVIKIVPRAGIKPALTKKPNFEFFPVNKQQ